MKEVDLFMRVNYYMYSQFDIGVIHGSFVTDLMYTNSYPSEEDYNEIMYGTKLKFDSLPLYNAKDYTEPIPEVY